MRFCIPLGGSPLPENDRPRHNTFAASPGPVGLGAYYELLVRCSGRVDPRTGYLMNISRIDEAVRRHAIPAIAAAVDEPGADPARILLALVPPIGEALDAAVTSITWRLTPFHSITVDACTMSEVLFQQRFSFAAAHRLHCPDLDDERNRAIFGKCNNENGHGHNYVLEVAVAAPLPGPDQAFAHHTLERIVDERVVRRFDHTHLNLDTAEFASLNPSVEHIARVCFDLLRASLREAGADLRWVTVWETEKTSCTYPAPAAVLHGS